MRSIQFCIVIVALLLGLAASAQPQALAFDGSLESCPKRYPVLYVPEGMCEEGGAIEWRLRLGGGIPWRAYSLWTTPIGYCFQLNQAIWDHWANGWFDNRCVYTDNRPDTDWYPVPEPRIGSWLDISCTNTELNPPEPDWGALQ